MPKLKKPVLIDLDNTRPEMIEYYASHLDNPQVIEGLGLDPEEDAAQRRLTMARHFLKNVEFVRKDEVAHKNFVKNIDEYVAHLDKIMPFGVKMTAKVLGVTDKELAFILGVK